MYGVIKAELIRGSGLRFAPRPHPWVARITRLDSRFGFKREFLKGVYDYTYARKSGGRGTYVYWALAPGVYEVYRPVSWKHEERFFCRVDDAGDVTEITREEVDAWLNQTSDT